MRGEILEFRLSHISLLSSHIYERKFYGDKKKGNSENA